MPFLAHYLCVYFCLFCYKGEQKIESGWSLLGQVTRVMMTIMYFCVSWKIVISVWIYQCTLIHITFSYNPVRAAVHRQNIGLETLDCVILTLEIHKHGWVNTFLLINCLHFLSILVSPDMSKIHSFSEILDHSLPKKFLIMMWWCDNNMQ